MSIDAMKQALEALENVYGKGKRCEAAITALRAAIEQAEKQEPFFTAANGFPQRFVPKDHQKQAILSLTDQCAALIQERDELQKQVWLYEKNGVTCQTYRHAIEQSCSECNVQMKYTAPVDAVNIKPERVDETAKHEHGVKLDASAPLVVQPHPAFQKWQGLTDEDREDILRWVEWKEVGSQPVAPQKLIAYVERKLREKNT